MNNKVTISIVALLILVTGTAFLVFNNENDADQSNQQVSESTVDETLQQNDTSVSEQDVVAVPESAGSYIEYSEQALIDTSGTKQVVFFHAPWCSTCNFFEGQIEEQDVPAGVTILKVDYDNDTATKEKYGVNIQSTFVLLDEGGEVVNTWPFARGLRSIQDLYDQV